MKKYSIKAFAALLLLLVFNQSCTDLDEELFDQVTADSFFKTEEEFISALGAAYTSLYGYTGHNSYFTTQEVSSDELMIPQRGGDWFDGGLWLRTHRHQFDWNDPNFNNAWNFLYGGVNTTNRLLFQFNELLESGAVEEELAGPFLSELKILRAFWYFLLLDTFGNVPLVTQFDVPDNFLPETETRANVYAFVEQELLANINDLSRATDGTTYGRMQYWAAQTLLAKLYLNAEVYTGTPQWEKALAACNEVINSGNYSLEGAYFANFNIDNSGSNENIWSIPYDKVFATGFNLVQQTLHYSSQNTFNLRDQPWNGYCSLQEFYESYDDSDIRKGVSGNQQIRGNFLAGPQFDSDGKTPIVDVTFNAALEEAAVGTSGPEVVFTPELNELEPNACRQCGVRVGKFEYEVGGTPDMSNDFPIFRYADVLLMKAEALWRINKGDSEALALVNQIRTRAGVEPFDALDADGANLLAERGREMFYEGWRRQDLIRFGVWGEEWDFKPSSEPCKQLWPIPFPQIEANPSLTQNPCF